MLWLIDASDLKGKPHPRWVRVSCPSTGQVGEVEIAPWLDEGGGLVAMGQVVIRHHLATGVVYATLDWSPSVHVGSVARNRRCS